MTVRKYYHDSSITNFTARIVDRIPHGDHWDIILDETFFYPESGGQPYDTGSINGVPVLNVQIRKAGGEIVHTVEKEIPEDRVSCEIDWDRRFDHMQQHTGQHILSAAFERLADAETIGFHLGAEASTIDLDRMEISPDIIEAVEDLVNEVVFSDRPVSVYEMDPDQVAKLPLRKQPAAREMIRIVHVHELDYSPCGGTHVQRTGEIGLLKITGVENRSRGIRIEFLCGRRAMDDYRTKHELITRIANDLTTGYRELDRTIVKLVQENKDASKEISRINQHLLVYQSRELIETAQECQEFRLVCQALTDVDRKDLGVMARNIIQAPKMIALLGLAGEKSHFIFARSPDIDPNMVDLLSCALEFLNSKSGGGRPDIAQGGGPPASKDRVWQAIERAKERLFDTGKFEKD